MSQSVKDQVIFAIFSAEARGLTGKDKARSIRENMREKYGGYWNVAFGDPKMFGHSIYKTAGHLGNFLYEGLEWLVWE